MTHGQAEISGQYDVIFDSDNRQRMAAIILCKRADLADILEKAFDLRFQGGIKGSRSAKKVGKVTVTGSADSKEKLLQAFSIMQTLLTARTYITKEMAIDMAKQINQSGKYLPGQFKAAANENQNRGQQRPKHGAYSFEARTESQAKLWTMIEENTLTFGVGPAGTGKTHVAVARAVKALQTGNVQKIMLARPAITNGKDPGALPGDMAEKLAPYLRPLYDELNEVLGPEKLKNLLGNGTIEIVPLEMMRGRTFKNAAVIVDEAQNCTQEQMRMALTRIGEGSIMVVTGDPMQTDLKDKSESGLKWAYERLDGKTGIGVQYFSPEDVVRHEIVRVIVEALDDNDEANPGVTRQLVTPKGAPRGPGAK